MRGHNRWEAPQAPLTLDSEEPTAPTSHGDRNVVRAGDRNVARAGDRNVARAADRNVARAAAGDAARFDDWHGDEERTGWAGRYQTAAAPAEPATSYWRGDAPARQAPAVRFPDHEGWSHGGPEAATSYQRPGRGGQPAGQAVRSPDVEPATACWRGAPAASPPIAAPREETLLAAARGGVGRAAPAVAAPSLPPPAQAGAPSRRLRPLPARAPSHLPADDGWTDEAERTVARDGRELREVSGARRAPAAPAAATSPAAGDRADRPDRADRADRRSRAAAGELPERPSTAAGSGARRLPEPPSAAAVEPASTAAPSAPSASSGPQGPQGPQGPLRIEAPPEVALAAYPLVRRVALQQDLKAADRILRVGLSELTNSTTCRTWYIGADAERFSLELTGELSAAEKALLDQSAEASQPRASGRTLVVPVIAASRVIALALFSRTEQMPVFGPADLMIAMVVMQETSGLLVQLLMNHAEQQRDLDADKKSIYNPEALANQRKRGQEGGLIHLSPRWVRIAYPSAVGAVLIAILFAVLAKVPTYSAGAGVITIEGIEITAPSAGSVSTVHVEPGQPVRAGEELARLLAQDEESALAQADREYRNALATLLFDGADETTKAAVAAAATNRQRAVDRLEAKVIRAPEDGVVGDIRVRTGAAMNVGDHVLTLLRKDAEPTVLVFLPGQDRPRLRRGQPLQIELAGYTKVREKGTIVEVGAEVIGPNEARRALGQKNADAVPLNGPVVMVRASLPTRTFKVNHDTFRYHDGMPLRGEVKVESKPFLISLIPALEKAL